MTKKNEDEDNNDHLCSSPAEEDPNIERIKFQVMYYVN